MKLKNYTCSVNSKKYLLLSDEAEVPSQERDPQQHVQEACLCRQYSQIKEQLHHCIITIKGAYIYGDFSNYI